MSDAIPTIGVYRGISLHDRQNAARLKVVKSEIDSVHGMADVGDLVIWLQDCSCSPESRLFASLKVEAAVALSVDERRARPDVDLDFVRACTAGLSSRTWRSATHYCSDLEPHDKAVPR